ncbi:hypothetical protein ACHAXT_000043 [Thalassiosira profunda]
MASVAIRLAASARALCLGGSRSYLLRRSLQNNEVHRPIAIAAIRAFSAANAEQPLRRRRKRGGSLLPADEGASSAAANRLDPGDHTDGSPDSAGFAPKDAAGNTLTADEYLSLASLSPWVPCPDTVVRRALEIAEASADDVHADLGCGDGRLNFAAVADPFEVRESWGVDVDENILGRCRERVGRRFVPTGFGKGGGANEGKGDAASEADKLEFVQADLLRVIDRQRERHQKQQLSDNGASASASKEDEITQRLSRTDLVTMYFVNDALVQLKPYLESVLGGKPNVRVITVGYEMKGWEAAWAERVLGLTVFRYDMKDVANDPVEWREGAEGGENESTTDASKATADPGNPLEAYDVGGEYSDVDESSELAQYLREKRDQDLDELDDRLVIEHDEKLDDFAQFRSKRKAQEAHSVLDDDDEEEFDDDWDDTEDPQELMQEGQRIAAEARASERGKGMTAGLDAGEQPKAKKSAGKAKPVWKKP